jgi:L-ascorbate metabolism protein UlaG (beta-lactamase superfamily)
MKLKWLGHSAFLLTAADGTRLLADPYVTGSYDGALSYGRIVEPADGVTISHDHPDHAGYATLPGNPRRVNGTGEFSVGPFTIHGHHTWHDRENGAKRGANVVYVFEADGLRVCHCGDLGHVLSADAAAAIGPVDVLLVPVGGLYTLDAGEAHQVARQLEARVVIPMHFKTSRIGFNIAPVDGFLADQPRVTRTGTAEVELDADRLPPEPEIWLMDHAL